MPLPFCNISCIDTLPSFTGEGCEVQLRPGGIRRLVFAKCDVEFTEGEGEGSIYDSAAWATKIAAGEISVTNLVLASKGEDTVNQKKIRSCEPEVVVSREQTITFTDSNATDSLVEFDAYNFLRLNSGQIAFGWTGCDGDEFYGFVANAVPNVSHVIPESNDDEQVFSGTITFKELNIIKPITVPGLEAVFASALAS